MKRKFDQQVRTRAVGTGGRGQGGRLLHYIFDYPETSRNLREGFRIFLLIKHPSDFQTFLRHCIDTYKLQNSAYQRPHTQPCTRHTMVFLLWFCSVIHFCPTRCIYMKYTYMYMYYFSNFVNCPSRCLIYMILPFSMLIFFWFCPSRCLIYMILPFSMLNFFVFAYASWRAKMEKYKH